MFGDVIRRRLSALIPPLALIMTPYHEHFLPIFLAGCFVAAIASVFAGRASGCALPGTLLLIGVLSFWASLFFGSDYGYRTWQSTPDPPPEAFSDASVLGALIAGWVPGGLSCLTVFGVVRGFRRLDRGANRQGYPEEPGMTSQRDTGNPYQGPNAG